MIQEELRFGRFVGEPAAEGRTMFTPAERQLFVDLVSELRSLYGARLLDVKFFGSRARGDAMERSDYDFLAFLDACDYSVEVPKLEPVAYGLTLKHGLGGVSISPLSKEQFLGLDNKYPGFVEKCNCEAASLLKVRPLKQCNTSATL